MAMIISNEKIRTYLDVTSSILAKHRTLTVNHIEHSNLNA